MSEWNGKVLPGQPAARQPWKEWQAKGLSSISVSVERKENNSSLCDFSNILTASIKQSAMVLDQFRVQWERSRYPQNLKLRKKSNEVLRASGWLKNVWFTCWITLKSLKNLFACCWQIGDFQVHAQVLVTLWVVIAISLALPLNSQLNTWWILWWDI